MEKGVRTEVVKRRLAFEDDPARFVGSYAAEEKKLSEAIEAAQAKLGDVVMPDEMMGLIAEICIAYGVDGMRADLVIHKTAKTICAWELGNEVDAAHVRRAAELAMPHRQRKQPFDEPGFDKSKLDEVMENHQNQAEHTSGERESETESEGD